MHEPLDMTVVWLILLSFLILVAGALVISYRSWRHEEEQQERINRENHRRLRGLRWRDGVWYRCDSNGCGDGNGNQQS